MQFSTQLSRDSSNRKRWQSRTPVWSIASTQHSVFFQLVKNPHTRCMMASRHTQGLHGEESCRGTRRQVWQPPGSRQINTNWNKIFISLPQYHLKHICTKDCRPVTKGPSLLAHKSRWLSSSKKVSRTYPIYFGSTLLRDELQESVKFCFKIKL